MKEPYTRVWAGLKETNKWMVKHLRPSNTGNSIPKPEGTRGENGYQKLER